MEPETHSEITTDTKRCPNRRLRGLSSSATAMDYMEGANQEIESKALNINL